MTFLEILERIEKIRKLGQQQAVTAWEELRVQVRNEHGETHEASLKKIAAGYELDALNRESITLYDRVLPLCELAYLYEQNGDAKEHADKIARIFKDEAAVVTWLLKYGRRIKESGYLVHDACLFDLPEPDTCTFSHWKKLANQGDNMLTPSFRKLLPHAPAIEKLVEAMLKTKNSPKPDSKAIEAAEKDVKIATSNYRKKKRESSDNLSADEKIKRTEALKDLAVKKLAANLKLAQLCRGIPVDMLTAQRLKAYYELYKITSDQSHKILIDNGISEKDIAVFYALERRNDDQAIPNILINGEEIGYPGVYLKKLDILSEQGAAIAACLGRMPKINCCQYFGGAGASCAQHGISSPNGGFYVLCRGNANAPNIDDEIWAASWVWNSQNGALCLDSVESQHRDKLVIITDMYRYASHKICHNQIPGQRPITHINTGAQSGVSTKVALKDYPAPHEHFRDYAGYTDAKSQLMLANSSMPYLFYGQVQSAAFQEMVKKQSEDFFNAIFQNARSLKDSEPLKQAIAFALHGHNDNLLALLKASAGERMDELQSLIEVNRRYVEKLNHNNIDFDALENGAYLNAMNKEGNSALHLAALAGNETDVRRLINSGINLDIQDKNGNSALVRLLKQVLYRNKKEQAHLLAKVLIEAGANIDIKDNDENTPLIIAVKNGDFTMVRYLVDDYNADIETFDADMKTAIFWAAEKGAGDIFNYLLNKNANLTLISYNRKDSLLMVAVEGGNQEIIKVLLSRKGVDIGYKNEIKKTVLHCSVDKPESLQVLLALIPEEQRLDALNVANMYGQTAFHLAAENHESLKVLFAALPEEQRLDAVKVTHDSGQTVLHWVRKNPESLRAIFAFIPEEQRLDAVKVTNKYGETVLHCSTENPESLKVLFALIPKEQRLDTVKITNKYGQTVLHCSAGKPESLQVLFAHIPEEQRLDAIKVVDKSEKTVLHLAAKNPESLQVLFALIPEEQRLDALKVVNESGDTVLHLAAENPESLNVLFTLIPEEQRLDAAKLAKLDDAKWDSDNYGETVMHRSADKQPESLKVLFAHIPEKQWLDAVKVTAHSGQTVLHWAVAQNPESLKVLFAHIPEEQRLDALKVVDERGQTVLHWVARNLKSLEVLFAHIPEEQRLDAVKVANESGDTVLHYLANEPESLKVLFALISEKQWLEAVKVTDNSGQTVLHLAAAQNRESLQVLLALIPEEQRLDAVKMANESGETVLHYLAKNPESLQVLIALIPEEQWLDAVKIANKSGETVLHYLANKPWFLKVFLALIPEKQRLDALKVTNKSGETVLHLVAKNPASLKVVQALTLAQKPVSSDAFFQPAPSFETPPTAPKVSDSRQGSFIF